MHFRQQVVHPLRTHEPCAEYSWDEALHRVRARFCGLCGPDGRKSSQAIHMSPLISCRRPARVPLAGLGKLCISCPDPARPRGWGPAALPRLSQVVPACSIIPSADRQLFPSPSRFRCDRRDPDYGRPGGDRPIHQSVAGRACLSVGADPEAARPGLERDRGGARHRPLYAAGGRPRSSGSRIIAASSACRGSSVLGPRSAATCGHGAPGCGNRSHRVWRPAHPQCGHIKRIDALELHHAA